MYSFVLSTVNQLGNMSVAGRRSPPQDDTTPAAACNVLRHCTDMTCSST